MYERNWLDRLRGFLVTGLMLSVPVSMWWAAEKLDRNSLRTALARGYDAVMRIVAHDGSTGPAGEARGSPLARAVLRGDPSAVRSLLEKGAQVDERDTLGRTPLQLAAVSGDQELVRDLLRHGADPNARIGGGQTPLMLAAGLGRSDIVRILLDHGANANLASADGSRALDAAEWSGSGSTVRVLSDWQRANPVRHSAQAAQPRKLRI